MKRFLTVWAALAVAAPAVAEELLIQGPNDSIIRMQVDACPDGRSCLMTSRISEGDVNIVVPEWAAPVNSEDWQDSIAERAYLRGLSDGYVFDFCAHCDC